MGVEEVVKSGVFGGHVVVEAVVVLSWWRVVFRWSCGGDWVVIL